MKIILIRNFKKKIVLRDGGRNFSKIRMGKGQKKT